jgi:hypothetical protein
MVYYLLLFYLSKILPDIKESILTLVLFVQIKISLCVNSKGMLPVSSHNSSQKAFINVIQYVSQSDLQISHEAILGLMSA